MRLYTTTGASQVDDPEFGTFTADANGAFDGLPDAMYAKLHGRPGWENDPERELRITREELDRFRDPAELLKAVKELGANQGVLASAIASALGLVQAPTASTEALAQVQDAVPTTPAVAPESASEVPNSEGDSATEPDESSIDKAESEISVETPSSAKTTSGRGRGSKAAKSAASDAA
jgi:hypothetical protein